MDWISDSDDGDDGGGPGRRPPSSIAPSSSPPGLTKKLEGCCSAAAEGGASSSNLMDHFVAMGFPKELVAKAIKENGQGDSDAILELVLTYAAIDKSPTHKESSPVVCLSESDDGDWDDGGSGSGASEDFEDKDFVAELSEKERKLLTLVEMGFTTDEASSAIDRCGEDAAVSVLADSIYAAQQAEKFGGQFRQPTRSIPAEDEYAENAGYTSGRQNKRRTLIDTTSTKRRCYTDQREQVIRKAFMGCEGDGRRISIPNPMVGFSIPNETIRVMKNRSLPAAVVGPPFFYYENAALAPRGVWATISRYLYSIEPEFVDSKYFCAAARKRGYVHNLPIENRYSLLPMPPKTLQEAFPSTRKWWPSWDDRTQLNGLQTGTASGKHMERIRRALEKCDGTPPLTVQRFVLEECRQWNLVWVGLHKVAPLEPDEIEYLLGFPRNHTRGISRTERYRSLGNSLQVDTVAYHLSVLKEMFPDGMTVLSLFSGLGGAEIALHRLGVHMKTLVSVELSEINRGVLRSWWEQTNQTGKLIEIADVEQLTEDKLERYIRTNDGFDLVLGGSPCNNPAGSSRHGRDGLEGEESAYFYHYVRVLDLVKCIMGKS